MARLGPGFLDTFIRLPPEPDVSWELVPRRPRFLARHLRSEIAPWLGLIAVFGVAVGATASPAWAVLVGALAVAPLAVARWKLLIGWRAALFVTALATLLRLGGVFLGGVAVFGAVGLTLFTIYVSLSYRREIGLWSWTATVGVVTGLLGAALAATIPLGALLALLTDTLRSRRLAALALADQQEITGMERARRIGVEERSRVARELHDIVAHHMSMVAVRAETAPFRLPDMDDDARSEFAEISQAARESLNEIRSLLNVLRDGDAPRAPQPGLAQIEELVDATRKAGVEVELTVRGEPRPLRAALEVCAYRILQESLSNVSRHAPRERAEVWVEYGEDTLEMIVANASEDRVGDHGHGLTGMLERAAAVGGSVDARRRADGRFVVEASLPIDR